MFLFKKILRKEREKRSRKYIIDIYHKKTKINHKLFKESYRYVSHTWLSNNIVNYRRKFVKKPKQYIKILNIFLS